MDGTRTFLIGRHRVVVIDPGPDMEAHVRTLSAALEPAKEVQVLLTHRHGDHAGALPGLLETTGASLKEMKEGDRVSTDEGDLVALEIPGHTRDHLGFHWVDAGALFVGDLLLGRGNTTWIGEYLGCIQDYLDSLEKIRAVGAEVIYPGHGPPIISPDRTLDRFRRHRLERLEEVRRAREENLDGSPEDLAGAIYGGEIPEKLKKAARSSVEAALYHLDQE